MTIEYTISEDNKVSDTNTDITKQIELLHDEVKSIQKSVALILNRLPHIAHYELLAHEYRCYRDEY